MQCNLFDVCTLHRYYIKELVCCAQCSESFYVKDLWNSMFTYIWNFLPPISFTQFIFGISSVSCKPFYKGQKLFKMQYSTSIDINLVDHIIDLTICRILSHAPKQWCKILQKRGKVLLLFYILWKTLIYFFYTLLHTNFIAILGQLKYI